MKTIKLNLDKHLLVEIKVIAKELNLTLTQYINLALKHKLQEMQNDGQI